MPRVRVRIWVGVRARVRVKVRVRALVRVKVRVSPCLLTQKCEFPSLELKPMGDTYSLHRRHLQLGLGLMLGLGLGLGRVRLRLRVKVRVRISFRVGLGGRGGVASGLGLESVLEFVASHHCV